MNRTRLSLALAILVPFACKEGEKRGEPQAQSSRSAVPTATKAQDGADDERSPGARQHDEERAQKAVSDIIQIIVDGKPQGEWTIEKLNRVKTGTVAGPSDAGKEGWSLHDLASALVGPKARVIAVSASRTKRLEVEPSKWNDKKRTPVLRVNRRGEFKFQWVSDGAVLPLEPEMRSVRVIELSAM
jgi:hypothetical protein